ncbi:MAG: hypothetical protein IPP83_06340 [Flavobacteriales bacterium]|nr:hypothetical protein [Flavobacteriales bacterium]
MAPPSNTILHAALKRYVANGHEDNTMELLKLFGEKSCTVLLEVRAGANGQHQTPEYATMRDPDLGPTVWVYTTLGELPKQEGGIAVLTCTVMDLMGDLLKGDDVGVVFDPRSDHAVYFRWDGPKWVVRSVARMRAEKRAHLN